MRQWYLAIFDKNHLPLLLELDIIIGAEEVNIYHFFHWGGGSYHITKNIITNSSSLGGIHGGINHY